MAISTTNVLALPLAEADIASSNNEDWIDAFEYLAGENVNTADRLDLRGISFELMVRRAADNHEVVAWASTADGTIQLGTTPDSNVLIINVPFEQMRTRAPGVYVADMIARDAVYQRRVMIINLEIVEGITR
jgi:hypothetical protein